MARTTEEKLRRQLCRIGKAMWQRRMVAANDGNISARLPDGRVLCTPSGVGKGFLAPGKLSLLTLDGALVAGPPPSSEVRMHLRVYREEAGAGAVVHAHPPYATAFAVRGEPIVNRMLPESIVAMREVPVAPYATPSTEAVAESVAPFVRTHAGCLLANHGALTWGPDLMSAYLAMERLEFTAEFLTVLAGTGRDLPDDEIVRLRELFGVANGR